VHERGFAPPLLGVFFLGRLSLLVIGMSSGNRLGIVSAYNDVVFRILFRSAVVADGLETPAKFV
jgi:hypothetical protein